MTQPSWLGLTNMLLTPFQSMKDPTHEYPGYEIKPTDGEMSVLKFWEMLSSISLPLLLGQL